MAWDFSTDPQFAEQPQWVAGFGRGQIIPLETLKLDAAAFARRFAALLEVVSQNG